VLGFYGAGNPDSHLVADTGGSLGMHKDWTDPARMEAARTSIYDTLYILKFSGLAGV
jgi:hypothetical protein